MRRPRKSPSVRRRSRSKDQSARCPRSRSRQRSASKELKRPSKITDAPPPEPEVERPLGERKLYEIRGAVAQVHEFARRGEAEDSPGMVAAKAHLAEAIKEAIAAGVPPNDVIAAGTIQSGGAPPVPGVNPQVIPPPGAAPPLPGGAAPPDADRLERMQKAKNDSAAAAAAIAARLGSTPPRPRPIAPPSHGNNPELQAAAQAAAASMGLVGHHFSNFQQKPAPMQQHAMQGGHGGMLKPLPPPPTPPPASAMTMQSQMGAYHDNSGMMMQPQATVMERPPSKYGAIGSMLGIGLPGPPGIATTAAMQQAALQQASMSQAAMSQAVIPQAAMPHVAMQQAAMQQAAMPQVAMQQAAMQQTAMMPQAMMPSHTPQSHMQPSALPPPPPAIHPPTAPQASVQPDSTPAPGSISVPGLPGPGTAPVRPARPETKALAEEGDPVAIFVIQHGCDASSELALRKLPIEKQCQVLNSGPLNGTNPSAVLMSRIRKLQASP